MTKPAAAGTATDLASGSGAPELLDAIFRPRSIAVIGASTHRPEMFLAFAERERCLAVDGRIRLRDPAEGP